jgi:hypothetical protein
MSSTSVRKNLTLPSAGRAFVAEAYLTIVSPAWPWGYLRLAGIALSAEGLFLLLLSVSVPVGGLGLLSLLVGEGAFVASFAPGLRSGGRAVAAAASKTASAAPRAVRPRVCRVERNRPRCRREH